jgi:alkanesulfonate monooxygenase SsuD/methylene tetrahydromethanopterin reductase-like flavin-dependent oxidoreductase (luciferase family)
VPYAESRERFAETLDIVQRAWTEDTFSYAGKYFQYHDVCVVPKPYQKPHPPIRVAATSMDTFPAIGAQGFDLFAAVRTGTLSELAPNLVSYRAAYTAAGHPGKGGVFLRVPVYVAASFEQAVEDCRDSIMAFYRQLGEQLEASAHEAGARAIEQRDVRGRRLKETTFDEVLQEKVIVGTPEMVIDRLGSIASELQLDGILAELNCGGQVPREGVVRSLKLLCDEVMPAFA